MMITASNQESVTKALGSALPIRSHFTTYSGPLLDPARCLMIPENVAVAALRGVWSGSEGGLNLVPRRGLEPPLPSAFRPEIIQHPIHDQVSIQFSLPICANCKYPLVSPSKIPLVFTVECGLPGAFIAGF